MTQAPAIIAAEQFRQRQAAARRMVALGKWALPQAEARLRPWAALAAACGADLPELACTVTPLRPQPGTPARARIPAADICPRAEMLAELAQATAAALAADWRSPASQALLALHLHLPDRAELPTEDRRHGGETDISPVDHQDSPVDQQGLAA